MVAPVLLPLALLPYAGVTWTAPAECGSQGELEEWIAGYVPAASEGPPFSARASVTPTANGYRLDLRIERGGKTSSRSVESESCRVLAQTSALLVAVHLDALATARSPPLQTMAVEPTPSESAETAPRVPEPITGPTEETPTFRPEPMESTDPGEGPATATPSPPSPAVAPSGFIAAMLGGSARLLPQWAVGGALLGGLGTERWRIEGGGSTSLWPNIRYPTQPGTTARFLLIDGRLRGCPVLPVGPRVSLPICVGLRGGALRARGDRGVQTPRVRWTTWAATTVGASLAFRLTPRLGLRGGVDTALAWNRPRYTVGAEPQARLSFGRLGIEVFAAVEIHLGSQESSQKRRRPR